MVRIKGWNNITLPAICISYGHHHKAFKVQNLTGVTWSHFKKNVNALYIFSGILIQFPTSEDPPTCIILKTYSNKSWKVPKFVLWTEKVLVIITPKLPSRSLLVMLNYSYSKLVFMALAGGWGGWRYTKHKVQNGND